MPVDPRLATLTGADRDPTTRLMQRLADAERRLSALETRGQGVSAADGAPTAALPDGALYVDTFAHRLYVRSKGTWRFAGLT